MLKWAYPPLNFCLPEEVNNEIILFVHLKDKYLTTLPSLVSSYGVSCNFVIYV